MNDKKTVDWEAIEREYRAGQLSVSEIGRQHLVSHTAINKKAKAQSWTRNLAAKVKEAVSTRLVSDGVSAANARETIEAAAARVVEVVRSHRADIAQGRSIAKIMFDELTEAIERRDEIEEAIEDETSGDKGVKRRNMMLRAVALPSRASTLQSLSASVRTFIQLERQAFNIDSDTGGGDDGRERAPDDIEKSIESKLAGIAAAIGAKEVPGKPDA